MSTRAEVLAKRTPSKPQKVTIEKHGVTLWLRKLPFAKTKIMQANFHDPLLSRAEAILESYRLVFLFAAVNEDGSKFFTEEDWKDYEEDTDDGFPEALMEAYGNLVANESLSKEVKEAGNASGQTPSVAPSSE